MLSEIGAATSVSYNFITLLKKITKRDDLSPQELKVKIQNGLNVLNQVVELELHGFDTTEISEAVKSLNEWCYEAENLLDKQLIEGSSNHLKKIWNKLRKLIQSDEIKQVCEKANNSVNVIDKRLQNKSPEKNQRNDTHDDDHDNLVHLSGREHDSNNIIKEIVSCDGKGKSGVSIVGMSGIGKSLLARHIYNNHEICTEFPIRIWVNVKDGKFVWNDIKEEIENKHEAVLKGKKLQQNLFIVFDNLLEMKYLEWKSFTRYKTNLRDPSKDVKIVTMVTTRNGTISNWNCFIQFHLGLLPKKCCEEVIKTNAPSCTESVELVAEKCEGLPLVAEWLGTAIEQRSIVGYINNESLSRDNDFKKQIFPRLMSSYRGISSEQRRCFAYFSLFPASHCFTTDFLVHLWMGEGFIQPPEETQSLKQVEEKFDLVIQERLILQPSTQLNSFGQDFARLAALGACVLLDQGVWNKKVRHLSFLCKGFNIRWKEVLDNKRLRTFLSLRIGNEDGDSLKVPPNFCKKLSLLRVLSFKGLNIEKIPDCIHHLIHLRYFDISFTPVKILTKEFHRLHQTLMFLKLKGTNFSKWLDDFHKLTNLIYVDWDESDLRRVGMPCSIGKLSKLVSLPLFKVGAKEGYLISELKEMNKLQGTLTIMDLQRVKSYEEATKAMLKDKRDLTTIILEWNSNSNGSAENVLRGLEFNENVKELKLIKYDGENLPDWIKDSNLEKIHLKECGSLDFFLVLGKLKYLKTLILEDMESITELSCRSSDDTQEDDGRFPELESLELYNLTQLQKMTGLRTGDMKEICKFKAVGCTAIADLFADFALETADLARKQGIIKSIFENKGWGSTLEIKIDGVILQDGTITGLFYRINMV